MPNPRFKTPSRFPPGGFQFDQPEIGWSAPNPLSENVDALVDRIWQLRLNNPVLQRLQLPTSKRLIRAEVIAYNCAINPQACIDQQPQPEGEVTAVVTRKPAGCCGGAK